MPILPPKDESQKTVPITITLPRWQQERLDALAKERGYRSRSEVIARLLEWAFQELEREATMTLRGDVPSQATTIGAATPPRPTPEAGDLFIPMGISSVIPGQKVIEAQVREALGPQHEHAEQTPPKLTKYPAFIKVATKDIEKTAAEMGIVGAMVPKQSRREQASLTCRVTGCRQKPKIKGLCRDHYRAFVRRTLEVAFGEASGTGGYSRRKRKPQDIAKSADSKQRGSRPSSPD